LKKTRLAYKSFSLRGRQVWNKYIYLIAKRIVVRNCGILRRGNRACGALKYFNHPVLCYSFDVRFFHSLFFGLQLMLSLAYYKSPCTWKYDVLACRSFFIYFESTVPPARNRSSRRRHRKRSLFIAMRIWREMETRENVFV